MRENAGQITPNTNTFHAINVLGLNAECFEVSYFCLIDLSCPILAITKGLKETNTLKPSSVTRFFNKVVSVVLENSLEILASNNLEA